MEEKDMLLFLYSRMDRCMNEHLWSVTTVSAFNGVCISASSSKSFLIPGVAVAIFAAIMTAYGVYFLINRHIMFYDIRKETVAILEKYENVPGFMRSQRRAGDRVTYTAVALYILLELFSFVGVIAVSL